MLLDSLALASAIKAKSGFDPLRPCFCFVPTKKEGKHVCRNDIACSLANFAGATVDRALCYPEQDHGNARAACGNPDLDRPIVSPRRCGRDDQESVGQMISWKHFQLHRFPK